VRVRTVREPAPRVLGYVDEEHGTTYDPRERLPKGDTTCESTHSPAAAFSAARLRRPNEAGPRRTIKDGSPATSPLRGYGSQERRTYVRSRAVRHYRLRRCAPRQAKKTALLTIDGIVS